MPLGLTVLGRKKRLDEVPSDRRSDRSSTHTDNVHVIVLDTLFSREMVMHQTRASAHNFVGTNGSSDTAAADGNAAFDIARHYSSGKRDNEIRIVVTRVQAVGTKIDDFVPCPSKQCDKFLFQAESPVIRGDPNPHAFSSCQTQQKISLYALIRSTLVFSTCA
jgi:hypothetical protein